MVQAGRRGEPEEPNGTRQGSLPANDDSYWAEQTDAYKADRQETNPVLSDNRLKLGVFCMNCSGGMQFSTSETTEVTWPNMRTIAKLADAGGFEAIVPVGRWRGFGRDQHFHGRSYETLTFAAALSEATAQISVFATSHVPTIHPVVAAKQATTIDHVSGGRFTLNIVCGWSAIEFDMFGASLLEHDVRYDYAEEWLEVVRRLWTCEEEFDFSGRFFNIQKGFAQPKPVQRPMPPIMNAGQSPVGRRFMAKHADIAFTAFPPGELKEGIDRLRHTARDEFSRELQVWSSGGLVLCAPTEREAREQAWYHLVEKVDLDAAVDWDRQMGFLDPSVSSELADQRTREKREFAARNSPLVGTAEQIVSHLETMSMAGLDGLALMWLDYENGVRQWTREVMPLMEQAGLRTPISPSVR